MIRINGYPIDVALSEEHSFQSEVTEYPVESGSNVSDNIRNRPIEISLEGVVSDTPIGTIAVDPTRRADLGAPIPSRDAYTRLLAIRDAGETVVLETSLGKFENMALVGLNVPRDAKTGKALKFTVTFRQINIVTNVRTTVNASVPNANGKVNGGNRHPLLGLNGKPVPEAFETVPRWVTSYQSFSRETLRNTLGKPILTTTAATRLATGSKKDTFNGLEMDHYPIGKGQTADGFVQRGSDHKDTYYSMVVSVDKFGRASGVGHGTFQDDSTKIGDREVTYDYGDRSWKDSETNEVVKRVPPGENRWRGVTWGKNPPIE